MAFRAILKPSLLNKTWLVQYGNILLNYGNDIADSLIYGRLLLKLNNEIFL